MNSATQDSIERTISERLSDGLSLDDAVRLTLANNRVFRAEALDLEIAQANVVQACLPKNPGFDIGARFVTDGPGQIVDLGLIQPIVDLLLAPARRLVAQADLEAVRARLIASGLRAAGAARRAYYDYQASAEAAGLHTSVVLAAHASAEAAGAMAEAGNIIEMDANRERAYYEESRHGLSQAQADRYAKRERLNELMGLPNAKNAWQVEPRLPEVPAVNSTTPNVEHMAICSSRDLAASRAAIRALSRQLGLVRTGSVLRAVDVGAIAEVDQGEWSVGPALRIEIPLFDYGQAAVPRARAKACKATELHLALAARVRLRARVAQQEVGSAHRRARHLRATVLPLRQRIVEQAQQQFNAAQIGVFELITVKQDLVNAGQMYITAARDFWRARSMLDQILSGAIDDPQLGGQ